MEQKQLKFPSEEVELPSKGLLYPKENPLSSGKIEMKYMTAREEDILTNQNYIKNGTVIDKLLQSLILSKINFADLLIGDKNAIMIAARVLGYGKDYTFDYKGEEVNIDLSTLEPVDFDDDEIKDGKNEFFYTLPKTGAQISYKYLTHRDEVKITNELKGLKKINKHANPELTTRLKFMILSVNGSYEQKDIRDFVDNYFLAMDSRSFREHVSRKQPDVRLEFNHDGEDGFEEGVRIPIGVNFFWPDA